MEALFPVLVDEYLELSIQLMNNEDDLEVVGKLATCKSELANLLFSHHKNLDVVISEMNELAIKTNCVYSALIFFGQPDNLKLAKVIGDYYIDLEALYYYTSVRNTICDSNKNYYNDIKKKEKQSYFNLKKLAIELGITKSILKSVLQQFKIVCEHGFQDCTMTTVYTEDLVEAEEEYIKALQGRIVSLEKIQKSKSDLELALVGSCFYGDLIKYMNRLKAKSLRRN